jgi:predicted nucleic acid-binding protein
MAGYLLDTNVISETRRAKANPSVMALAPTSPAIGAKPPSIEKVGH